MRLTRVQDRMSIGGDEPWTINPRTGFLETWAPLTWTGVRPYQQPDGTVIRVLRRPEQVEAPKHMQRLRCLPGTHAHPPGDVNVSPANEATLKVGYTGDDLRVKVIEGYRCPTARVVVTRKSTIEAIQAGATQTSLGYTALWVEPPDEERARDPETGRECGVWQGPRGPEYYDLEHVLDPDCPLVRELAAKGFDSDQLGPNHFALALQRGRGGVQSELMRVVDSIELDRDGGVRDASPQWTVSADRDLPFAPDAVAWDGDAAAASVFEWAGFNSGSPDPSKARRAFLVHDAGAPELKGSYKLPIARYADGRLEVVKAGLDAAASYLPQTDIPQDTRDRARAVLDSYYTKFAAQVRDVQDTKPMTEIVKTKFTLAPSRDLASWAAKRNFAKHVPQSVTLTVERDEMDPEKIMAYVQGMEDLCAAMREEMGAMETKMEDMGADKAALEEIVKAKEAELEAAKAELAAASDAMRKSCDELKTERDSLKTERDSLLAEVAPLRKAELDRVRSLAVKAGVAKDVADSADSIPALRRAVVLARFPDNKTIFANANDDVIAGVYAVAVSGLAANPSTPAATPSTPTAAMPTPTLVTPRDQAERPKGAIREMAARLRRETPQA